MSTQATEAEWHRCYRGTKYPDVLQAIEKLVRGRVHDLEKVRITVAPAKAYLLRDAAAKSANRRRIRVATRLGDGWLYIRREAE